MQFLYEVPIVHRGATLTRIPRVSTPQPHLPLLRRPRRPTLLVAHLCPTRNLQSRRPPGSSSVPMSSATQAATDFMDQASQPWTFRFSKTPTCPESRRRLMFNFAQSSLIF